MLVAEGADGREVAESVPASSPRSPMADPMLRSEVMGPLELRRQVVLFADLLGFKERMRSIGSNSAAAALLLQEYSSTIGAALAVVNRYDGAFAYRSFGDSFMLAADTLHEDSESALGILLMAFAEVQLALVLKGWFVRGGLAFGDFFLDERLVFGPALVEAYSAETTLARDPRIVLTEGMASEVETHLRYYGDPYQAPHNGFLLGDTDGQLFINYLYSTVDGFEPDQTSVDACRAHKLCVENMLRSTRGLPTIWTKYAWAARYHNFFAHTWLSAVPGLQIDPAVFATHPELLVPSPR